MSDKARYPWGDADRVARQIAWMLAPACERIEIAGSLRRQKPTVGDVEILFIPRITQGTAEDFLAMRNHAEDALDAMLAEGVLARRVNKVGGTAWGPKNKLALHAESGIPVDLFTATAENWWNYLVCRTGPGESNIAICEAARAKGYKWHPYGSGFENLRGPGQFIVRSEEDVFGFVGLPYLPPERRSGDMPV